MNKSEQARIGDDPRELLDQANAVVLDILHHISPEQLALPTVNDDWTVRDVINHLVILNRWAVDLLQRGITAPREGDAIGSLAPVAAYAASWQALSAAFQEPGALERTMQLPIGDVSGAWLAEDRFADLMAHTWDLARATGQDTNIAPDLSEIALAIAQQRLNGHDRAQTPFKAEVAVPANASAADRLAAYLGKRRDRGSGVGDR